MWKYDDIIFDSVIRRSGGSLVITIPPELKRRFMLNEGQRVRLIGIVRKGFYVEGGILIYFGRFEINEKATKIIINVTRKEQLTDEDIKNLTLLLDKYNLTNYYINRIDKFNIKVELTISNISEEGIVHISKDDIKRVLREIERLGYNVKVVGEDIEELTWHGIDPSILVRYTSELPKNIKIKWILK